MFEKDFIKRSVQQLAKLLAAVMKLRTEGEEHKGLDTLREGVTELFGFEWRMLVAVDSHSAAQLLGHPNRIAAFARVRAEEAELLETQQDPLGAQTTRRHAYELYLEALRAGAKREPELIAAVRTLRDQLGDVGGDEGEALLSQA